MSDAPVVGLYFDLSPFASDPFSNRVQIREAELPPLELAKGIPPYLVSVAKRSWERRARSEYVGVMIFRHLHGLLVEVNAPMDIQETALAMLLHEQQHARLCMYAARRLGSTGQVTIPLGELQLPRSIKSPQEELIDHLCRVFATGEVVALSLLVYCAKALPKSGYRDLLRIIAKDEVLHGREGPIWLAASAAGRLPWLPYPGNEYVERVMESHVAKMRQRDVVHIEEQALYRDPEAAKELAALGVPPPDGFKAAYHRALDGVMGSLAWWRRKGDAYGG